MFFKNYKMPVTKNQTEIFRHIRPTWYDKQSHQILPLSHGGISFLLKPIEEKQYDFWIYICPPHAVFSSKQAVASLRAASLAEVVPYGRISLIDKPLVEQLTDFVIAGSGLWPSEACRQLSDITKANSYAQRKKDAAEALMQGSSGAVRAYYTKE